MEHRENWENLGFAIIAQTADDLRDDLKKYRKLENKIRDLISSLKSNYFNELSYGKGQKILDRLVEELNLTEDERNKFGI